MKRLSVYNIVAVFCSILLIAGCTKHHEDCDNGLAGKWKLNAKSGDGITWLPVSVSESHIIAFENNQSFIYNNSSTTNCLGTYTLDVNEVYINMPSCSDAFFPSQHIVSRTNTVLIFRPNSGAILPYTKYIRQ